MSLLKEKQEIIKDTFTNLDLAGEFVETEKSSSIVKKKYETVVGDIEVLVQHQNEAYVEDMTRSITFKKGGEELFKITCSYFRERYNIPAQHIGLSVKSVEIIEPTKIDSTLTSIALDDILNQINEICAEKIKTVKLNDNQEKNSPDSDILSKVKDIRENSTKPIPKNSVYDYYK